jgi:hypothetical protein
MVEHIFALAVGLQIGRSGGDQVRGVIFDEDRRGGPAGAQADATGILERGQESVAEERVAVREPVPGRGVQPRDVGRNLGDDLRFAVGHRLPR